MIEQSTEQLIRDLNKANLKIQALAEENTAKVVQIADLRADVTLLVNEVNRLNEAAPETPDEDEVENVEEEASSDS